MDYFGINSPEDLPKIREVFAEQLVEPTMIRHSDSETAEFLQADNSEEFPEPHMEEPASEVAEPAENSSEFIINDEGMLIAKKEDESSGETDNNEQQ
jgi:segregation and condensation protein B